MGFQYKSGMYWERNTKGGYKKYQIAKEYQIWKKYQKSEKVPEYKKKKNINAKK